MSRKNVYNYTILDAVSAAANFNTFANPYNVNYLDNASIQIFWTGTPEGEFKVFVSNDQVQSPHVPTNWSQLDFGTPIIIDSSNTDLIINMNQLPFSWIAVSYTSTSGTGNITAKTTVKMVGG